MHKTTHGDEHISGPWAARAKLPLHACAESAGRGCGVVRLRGERDRPAVIIHEEDGFDDHLPDVKVVVPRAWFPEGRHLWVLAVQRLESKGLFGRVAAGGDVDKLPCMAGGRSGTRWCTSHQNA